MRNLLRLLAYIFIFWLIVIIASFSLSKNNKNNNNETHSVELDNFFLRIKGLELPENYTELRYPQSINISSISNITCSLLKRNRKHETSEYKPLSYGFDVYNENKFFTFASHKTCNNDNLFDVNSGVYSTKPGEMVDVFEGCKRSDERFGNNSLKYELSKGTEYKFGEKCEFFFAKGYKGQGDAMLRNIYMQEYAEKAKKYAEEKMNYFNTTNTKPMTVVVFVVDSISRQGLFRCIPKTIEFLNYNVIDPEGKYSKKFAMYEFPLSNSIQAFTVPNLVPLLYGISEDLAKEFLAEKDINKPEHANFFTELQYKFSLFEHYRQHGFVTMFLNDVVTDYLSKITGRVIITDHQASNFWKLGNKFFGYSDFNSKDQCIGSNLPHYFSLKYLKEYLHNYKGNNRFAYVHINTAHAGIGTRLNIADNDFIGFFNEVLREYKELDEDFTFLFIGDHGTSRGDFLNIDGFAERVNPPYLLLSNKELVFRLKAHYNLEMNAFRLVSKYDWHKTLKMLAMAPYIDQPSEQYLNGKKLDGTFMFQETIHENKTCDDAGITPKYCLSIKFIDIDPLSYKQKDDLNYYIQNAITLINKVHQRNGCNTVTLSQVLRISKLDLDLEQELPTTHYLILISTNEDPNARFLIHGTTALSNQFNDLKVSGDFVILKKAPYKRVGKITYHSVFKIWSVSRLDSVPSNACENKVKYSKRYFYTEKNESCKDLCKDHGFSCSSPTFAHMILGYLAEMGYDIQKVGFDNSIEIVNGIAEVGKGDSCVMKYKGKGLCQCGI
ncbi:hypothetical protein SteCoe_9281 [Stentor coeruleus]|uniref:Uncharacterized protein n=1 Tax=Stentor coeruleus TaxID=5963 RepID=A0A1R2CIG1_9CILI|nr:hypothetical protein SteCoe_9281 [Stentor coeruleus]